MSYAVRAAPPEHRSWLEARIGRHIDPVTFRGVEAVRPDGSVVAMAGFEFWTESAVGIHVAADAPVALRHWREALTYPFKQLGKRALWALVAQSSPSLRLALRLGFYEAGRVPDGYAPGDDLVLVVMHKDEVT